MTVPNALILLQKCTQVLAFLGIRTFESDSNRRRKKLLIIPRYCINLFCHLADPTNACDKRRKALE